MFFVYELLMSTIKPLGNWIEIAKKAYFGDEPQKWLLCLSPMIGENMRYTKDKIIDFPGEYEIWNLAVIAHADKDWKMNYVIDFWNKKYTVVQSKKYLQSDECLDECAQWIFVTEGLKDIAIKNEYEWGFFDVSWEEREIWQLGAIKEE